LSRNNDTPVLSPTFNPTSMEAFEVNSVMGEKDVTGFRDELQLLGV
jgi:hypothetical protein